MCRLLSSASRPFERYRSPARKSYRCEAGSTRRSCDGAKLALGGIRKVLVIREAGHQLDAVGSSFTTITFSSGRPVPLERPWSAAQ